ncbi:MAG: DNA helicase UvrD [Pseudomonadales bacterium]|nr:DNA helicase UvrD [Pseudomonadales bacterium]|tara:strand:+ start:2102 stop:5440 length:3339 start_codon:yes stop_codon:yes gene_type:complete
MTAYQKLDTMPHLTDIMEAIAQGNPHDGNVRALSIDPRRSIALLAPAGSGKTTQLLYRLLACLTVAQRPEEILAITFTNKAAGEIVERVMEALSAAAKGHAPAEAHEMPLFQLSQLVLERDDKMGWNLLLNPSRLRIMTFDSFCAQLAAKTPIMSGLGGGKTLEDPSLVYRQAILETLGSVNDEHIEPELREALEAVLGFARNRFEALVPMFGALLAKRDQWVGDVLNLDMTEMADTVSNLAQTGAENAIKVLKRSVAVQAVELLQEASTLRDGFEWASSPIIDTSDAGLEYLRSFALYMLTADGKLRSRVNATNGMPAKERITIAMNDLLTKLKGDDGGVAEALNSLLVLPDLEYPARSKEMASHLAIILRYLMGNLMLAFDATASVDFPEVAQRAIQSLGAGDDVGDALLEEDRICHLLVDEFQDTSPAQFHLLGKLIEHWGEEENRSVFFCGDGCQSIYLFRGATVGMFTDMVRAKSFGAQELEVHHLVVNFRSAPAVVEWNNQAYSQVFDGMKSTFVPSVPFRNFDGEVIVEPVTSGVVAEGERVAEIIKQEMAENPEQSIAILVRGRSHLKHILPALREAGISASGTDIDPISESQPVSEVIALIRALWHKGDRTSWLALLRSAFVGLSWGDCLTVAQGHSVISQGLRMPEVNAKLSDDGRVRVARLVEALDGVEQTSRGDELGWAAKAVWVSLGGVASVDATELGDISTVFKLLSSHTSTGDLTDPQAFFNAVDKLFATPKAGHVQVMTIHKSKGLEFDVVILPSLQKGSVTDDTPLFYWKQINGSFVLAPNMGDQDPQTADSRLFKYIGQMVKTDVREELARVAYVATTRAKHKSYLLGCMTPPRNGADLKPPAGSLLGCLWGSVGDAFNNAEMGVEVMAESATGVPSKARLPSTFTVSLPSEIFVPVASNDSLPTENELEDELRESEGKDYRSKTRGIVFHRMVELITAQGGESWSVERVKAKSQAIASMLRREGYPIREIPEAVRIISDLLCTTVTSKKGQWVLAKHCGGGQEVRVSGYRQGRWVHRVIDRAFEDSGTYWIVDWKTAACPEGTSVDAFLASQVSKYRAKMIEYKRAVIDAGITLEVKLGLYLPAVDAFVEIAA